ncbi:MAG: 23S rRNA (adenine(2030)-N(6))-methyltransferase RlmJ [Paracoccaceae bacterium]
MLSYQHAYHAGNAADLHKHGALAALLALLTRKPRGVSYLESHAGRALYDLESVEARKTGEAAFGIALATPAGPFDAALATVRAAHGLAAYPGSPLLARCLLRPQDRLILCELHPGEHEALRAAMAADGPPVAIHRRDGHEGLLALVPPKPRRGLALIDPSYEVKDEYARTAATAEAVFGRWPEGTVMVWYPVLAAGRHRDLVARIRASGAPLLADERAILAAPPNAMQGTGLLVLNPPHGTNAAISAALAPLGALLGPPSASR